MAFGGLFGGSSSSSNDKDKKSTSSSEFAPSQPIDPPNSTANLSYSASSSLSSSASSSEIKARVQQAVSQQTAMMNARNLMNKVNEMCFDHCITAPGDRLSSKEEGCLSTCMDKYLEGWNVVHRTYAGLVQREAPGLMGSGGGGAGDGVF